MPYLQLHDAHHQLAPGETRVGRGSDADERLPEAGANELPRRVTARQLVGTGKPESVADERGGSTLLWFARRVLIAVPVFLVLQGCSWS